LAAVTSDYLLGQRENMEKFGTDSRQDLLITNWIADAPAQIEATEELLKFEEQFSEGAQTVFHVLHCLQ
jgi:hypothetical protein